MMADGCFYDVRRSRPPVPEEVSFLENRKYVEAFAHSRAGAAFVDEWAAERAPRGDGADRSARPRTKRMRAPRRPSTRNRATTPSRAPSAVIDPAAMVPDDCDIGPNVVIEAGVRLGAALPRSGQHGHRRRGRNRRRLPDRRQCDAQPLPDRLARRTAPRRADRPGRVRLRARSEPARSRFRNWAGSSSATMSISAPTPRSTAAPGMIP